MTEEKFKGRIRVVAGVVIFMFAALTTRLWFLQVVAAGEYQDRADENLVRFTAIPANRGEILDRRGAVLVRNRETHVITVDKRKVKNREDLLFRLSRVLDVPADELGKRLDDPDYGLFQPVPILEDAPERAVAYLAEHNEEFPGVEYAELSVRQYPFGALGAHVIGHLGQIGPSELGTPAFETYRPGQLVGRAGVEQQYERNLRGRDGSQAWQVDAQGDGVQMPDRRLPPVDGNDLVLTIHSRIQRVAEESLRDGVAAAKQTVHEESGFYLRAPAGAVVVLDPNNGQILAMASYPSFDPRIFYEGLSHPEWKGLNDPARNYPLNNRAIQAGYPPGSTLKPFVAAAAIRAGHASPRGFYPCPPEFRVPGDTSNTVFRNWKETDSGVISFARALIESCDTVFYQFGLDFYRDRKIRGELLQQMLRTWGFGRETGVDLPSEAEGRVPDAVWKALVHRKEPELFPDPVWFPGDTINMSIGQGDFLVTPLQLAASFAALVNGGTVYRPQVALRIQDGPEDVIRRFGTRPLWRVPFPRKTLRAIRDALRAVPSAGTAASAFAGFPLSAFPVAGKTGTSEVPGRQPHSWFAAAAPAENPKYVVVAIVEEGGHGSTVAAPIVRRILEGLFGLNPSPFRVGGATD